MDKTYWLISVPGESSSPKALEQVFQLVQDRTTHSNDLSLNYKFTVPDLKVGTLDSLVGLSDTLAKGSAFAESVTRKLGLSLADLLVDHQDKLPENLKANGMDLDSYLSRFQWDAAKYPIKLPMPELCELMTKQLSQIEADLKAKQATYSSTKNALASMARKATGNLLTRDLDALVKAEDFVLDSEYLVTVLVCVPKVAYKKWLNSYEQLTDMVVPRSSKLVFEDVDYGLYTVTMFQRVQDEFKNIAREEKFVVRDFEFDRERLALSKKEKGDLEGDLKGQWAALVRWCKTHFSEAFTTWVHLTALRVFVESVLRYGLPVNFQAILMQPHRKAEKKLRAALLDLFGHLDSRSGAGAGLGDLLQEMPGLAAQFQAEKGEDLPYVSFTLPLALTKAH